VGIKGKRPEEENRETHWTHDKCPGGTERTGWIAGDVHVIPCHISRATRPCLSRVCGKGVRCAPCTKHQYPTPTGFLPVFRDDGKPLFLIVYEHQFDRIEPLKFGAWVRWGRERGAGETVWVRAEAGGSRWVSSLPDRNQPADLTRTLCLIWDMPELRSPLLAYLNRPCQPAVTPPAESIADEIPGTPEWVRRTQQVAAETHAGKSWDELRESVTAKFALKPPSTNGKKKH